MTWKYDDAKGSLQTELPNYLLSSYYYYKLLTSTSSVVLQTVLQIAPNYYNHP